MTEDINVIVMNMEYGLHGHTCRNHDGSHTIFLNSRDSRERQLKAYDHELRHIKRGDFDKYDIQQIEYEAHNQ